MKNFLLFVFLFTFIVAESNLRGKEEDNEEPFEGVIDVPQELSSKLIIRTKDKKEREKEEKEIKEKQKEKRKSKDKNKSKNKNEIRFKNPKKGRITINYFPDEKSSEKEQKKENKKKKHK